MTARPRLLDLFCGAGGAAMGYHRAGFDVTGVDNRPQPRYPFTFHRGDAMTWPLDGFDAVHASPPCQDHSDLRSRAGIHGTGWMLSATLDRLAASGIPWVVENVPGAPMPGALLLCGAAFGLGVDGYALRRHRLFLSDVWLMGPGCACGDSPVLGVYGTGGGGRMTRGVKADIRQARLLIDCPWMTTAELSQAIPPAYTEHVGLQMLAALNLTERTA
jgi:DNA (cytosine-5)-methyltransferase 1